SRTACGVTLAGSRSCSSGALMGSGIGGGRTVACCDGSGRRAGDVSTLFVISGGDVIFHRRGIKAGEEPVFRQLEPLLHDKRRIGVISDVILGVAIVLNRVIDQAAQEGNISAGADLAEDVRL